MQVRFSAPVASMRFGIKTDMEYGPTSPGNASINPSVAQNLAATKVFMDTFKKRSQKSAFADSILQAVSVAIEPLYQAVNQMAQDLYQHRP